MAGSGRGCASCGADNDPSARFCMRCGTPFADEAAPVAAAVAGPAIERKVITALFCDVVGSTELAERLDAEDVDRLLRTYHALARRRIEAHGGTLEKFIGDAVLGVFGAPAAHEDDPARAVRASRRIIRDLAESGLDLHVRIGVHTGEAVVRVGDDRSAEEGLATGDTLNTAARLQNVAPVDGIVVSEATHRAAAGSFVWDDLGEVSVKGKAEPLRIWQPTGEPTAPVAHDATPFLGRDAELGAVVSAFERVTERRSVELVTLLAEAGMGKSRLVREVARAVVAIAPTVVWRTGRCLPYGDGISFWALGEIAKSSAGILETDDQDEIGRKLDDSLREPDPELRSWMRDRLAPLVGLRTQMAPPAKEEAFAAWRRFLAQLTHDGPAVIVVEDLHWADTALVEFLVDLVDDGADVPLLVLVTTRPEVAERHPDWLDRAAQSTVVQLVSLGDDAIEALVRSTLVGATSELLAVVLERAAGSPLYAEQLAALVREQGLSATDATLHADVIPPTIQALLTARIDALPRGLKPTLLDASVIGRVFWSGAVAQLEEASTDEVAAALDDIVGRDLARPLEPSSMIGEAEYGFWHALLRDVAYSFLPRAARLTKHRAAAAWITERVGGQVDDLAEIVVDHLRRAGELAEATGSDDDARAIRADLATALLAAGEHAFRVQPARAQAFLLEVLDLLDEHDPRVGDALESLAEVMLAIGEQRELALRLGEARAWRNAHGDELAGAAIAVREADALNRIGESAASEALLDTVRPTLQASPGQGLVDLLGYESFVLYHRDPAAGLARANEALALAAELGLPEPAAALTSRGGSRLALGDRSAEDDLRQAIANAVASGRMRDALIGYMRLAGSLIDCATAEEALPVYDEALVFARDHGLSDQQVRAQRLDAFELAGEYDAILDEIPSLRAVGIATGNEWTVLMADMFEQGIHQLRGEFTPPPPDYVEKSFAVGFSPSGTYCTPAEMEFLRGHHEGVRQYAERALDETPADQTVFSLVPWVRMLVRIDDLDLARRFLARAAPPGPYARGYLTLAAEALVAEAGGDPGAAAPKWAESAAFFTARGWVWNSAFTLSGCGRCSIALGDVEGGVAQMRQARALAERSHIQPLLDEIDAALNAVPASALHQDPTSGSL